MNNNNNEIQTSIYSNNELTLQVKLLNNQKLTPFKKYNTDAAYDLYTVEKTIIYPLTTTKLKVDTCIKIPTNYVGILIPRSSYRLKGLVCHSIIDAHYTGTLDPIVTYIKQPTEEPLIIEKGERVIQLLILSIPNTILLLTSEFSIDSDEKEENIRGINGFGSTGKF